MKIFYKSMYIYNAVQKKSKYRRKLYILVKWAVVIYSSGNRKAAVLTIDSGKYINTLMESRESMRPNVG